ncbi:MAG: hypothetical protein HC915_09955 [Anaerolineae bacterium]|nr:hypothetical protein [Anaerolineae bacterium]
MLAQKLRLDPRAMVEWATGQTMQRTAALRHRPAAPLPEPAQANPPSAHVVPQGSALERRLLALLLLDPMRLFEVNRVLRLVDQSVNEGRPLPIHLDDFSSAEHQVIFQCVHAACQQDQQNPVDYLQDALPRDLHPLLNEILAEPLAVFVQRAGRLHATEMASVQREQQQRFGGGSSNTAAELTLLALRLRRERLQRQQKDLYFLQLAAEEQGEEDEALHYGAQVTPLMQRLRALDAAIGKGVEYLIMPQQAAHLRGNGSNPV